MTDITSLVAAATQLFATIAVLCVAVVGFFLGRKWLRRAGEDTGAGASDPTETAEMASWGGKEVYMAYAAEGKVGGYGREGSGLHRGRR